MQIAVGSNNKPVTGKEGEKKHDNCNNCSKSSFVMLLEKIWNYQMPPRWIFFFFVLQAFIGILITKYFIVQYFRNEHLFYIVFGNLAFLYLWLLATGRTILRLRTPQEVSEKTSFALLRTTGIFFLFSGILMCVGENGVRSLALGDSNSNSIPFNIAASTTFMLGIFNLVLSSKTNINRCLTFVVLLANCLTFLYGTFWVTNIARLFQRFCWSDPMCIYSVEQDFPSRWVETHGANNAIPFGSITTFDFLRTVPVYAVIFLAGGVTLALMYAMIKIGMAEEKNTGSNVAKKVPKKKNHITAIIGLAITLVSFLTIKCLSDANSMLYLRFHEMSLAAIVLTPLGLLGMATLSGRTPSWFRALLMAAAATTFIAAYSTLDIANSFDVEARNTFESIIYSNCTGTSQNKNDYDYPAPPPPPSDLYSETTTETIVSSPNQACFNIKDGWKKVGIKCIPKEKLCDGVVDIVEPVQVCSTIPNYYIYQGGIGAHFIDEIFCASNGIDSIAATIRAVYWLSMLLPLAMVVALAFTFKNDDDDNDDKTLDDVEKKERMAFLHVLDKFQGTLFSKVSNEDIPTVQEDTPTIKKKLDNPC